MSVPVRLVAFVLLLVLLAAGGALTGAAVGPTPEDGVPATVHDGGHLGVHR